MHLQVFDLDGSLTGQASLAGAAPWQAVRTLDFRDIGPKLRLWSRAATIDTARRRIAGSTTDRAITLLGSGDFHHVAALLHERVREPFTLVHFDNHPDWIRLAPRWHCGSWLNRTLALSNLRRAITLGPCSDDLVNPGIKGGNLAALDSGRLQLHPWQHAPSRVFHRIESAALQAVSLVDQLSDLHSLDGSGIALERRPADLRRTVEAAKDQMEAIARGHALRYTGSGESVMVDYDERRIQRVLQNLISNAIKYSPDGGDIDINIHADGSDAAISIRDHGIGIPEADRGHVFERGYRANTVGAIPGTGLGLFISSEIVKRHGGSIGCRAADGRGTVFEVRLPLARIHGAAERVQELPGYRAGPAAADRAVVHRDDRNQFPRRAREERLVRSE